MRLCQVFLLLAMGLFHFWAGQAVAQTTDGTIEEDTEATNPEMPETGDAIDPDGDAPEPEDPPVETPNATNPPPFMAELLDIAGLTQEKVDQMRTSGMGWGEIRIATRLAEQMAAGSDGALTFEDALAEVLAAREAGKGFGQIAGEHNLKIGQLVQNDRAEAAANKGTENAAGAKAEAAEFKTAGKEKTGLLARVGRFLGFGKPEQPVKPSDVEKPAKTERPEKASKPGRPERPVAVERSIASARPEVPSRPERPAKPERPNRGPDR
ncbi:MAG TPA: hypothetical protein VLI39_01400 [Sedimentisphaerales bacterium]|nr:hypothetical protein [Sedimentisphaerales bacterium]